MKITEFFPDEDARAVLARHQLANFDALWTLDAGWFEEPNKRRGGWSGVSRYRIGNSQGLFIKRQENHFYRTWSNFFIPALTFEREFRNLLKFQKLGIPTLDLVYFGRRKNKGDSQAILVTRELEGYIPLDNAMLQASLKNDGRLRKLVISKVADVVRNMHHKHMQHNCLYPKHLFVREGGELDVRFIDLEKAKWRPFRRLIAIRDFGTLYRHTEGWRRTDQLRLFLAYRQETRLGRESRKILEAILGRRKKTGSPRT